MQWDSSMFNSVTGVGEIITIRYTFKDPSGVTGSCSFTVKPEDSDSGSGSGSGGSGDGGSTLDVQQTPESTL